MNPHFSEMDDADDDTVDTRPGWIAILISLVVLVALLASLVWPLLQPQRPRATPTPSIFLEANLSQPSSHQ